MDDTQRLARQLGQELASLRKDVEYLKRVGRSAQLGHSSIDDRWLESRVDGEIRATWGLQPDGRVGTVDLPGPPPPQPTVPIITSIVAGLDGTWDGGFVDATKPADFSHVLIYASDEGAEFSVEGLEPWGTLTHAGTFPIVPLEADTEYWLKFVAVSRSGVESEPSEAASGTPTAVVATELLEGIVEEINIADGAVTQAKVAVGAIDEERLAEEVAEALNDAYSNAAQAVLDVVTAQAAADAAQSSADGAQSTADSAQAAADLAQATADGAIRTYYQSDEPEGLNDTTDLGDLWFDTDNNQAYRWNGTEFVLIQDNSIAEALAAAADAQSTADGKIVSFFASTPPTAEGVGDIWYDTAHGNLAHRWDGDEWDPLAAGSDAIQFDAITVDHMSANSVGTDQLIAAAIMAVHIAANQIEASHIVAAAIQAGHIDVEQIYGYHIVAEEITTEHLAALAVTAAKIAANAIEAGHIVAGAVTAEKLDAVIVLASKIIAGTLGGARLELDEAGLVQYDDEDQPTVSIGASPDGGNYFNVRGPVTITRRNLSTNPKLDVDATGYSAVAGTSGSRVSGSRVGTDWCYRFTDSGSATWQCRLAGGEIPQDVAMVTVSFLVNPSSTSTLTPNVRWRNSAGTDETVTSGQGSGVSCPANTITRLSVTAPVPEFSYQPVPFLTAGNLGSGVFVEVSQVLIEPTNVLDSYFDGDSVLGGNVLENPGFEDGEAGWTWGPYSGIATSTVRTGANSALLSSFGSYVTESALHVVEPGASIDASAWVAKGIDPSSGAYRLDVAYFDENGTPVDSDTITDAVSGSFIQVADTFTVPDGAARARLSISNVGVANIYVDDCALNIGRSATWDGDDGASSSTYVTSSAATASLATLDITGGLAVQHLAVEDRNPIFGGITLTDRLDSSPGRIVARNQIAASSGFSPNNTGANNSEVSWGNDLSFVAEQGRLYEVCVSPITARSGNIGVRIHYTVDGTTPTTSSPWLTTGSPLQDSSSSLEVPYSFGRTQVRLLLSIVKFSGGSGTNVRGQAPNGDAGVQMWVRDAGPDTVFTNYWTNTWTRSFMHISSGGDPGDVRSDEDMVQGWSIQAGVEHCATQIGFDYTNIQSVLSGKTIRQASLYVYNYYWVNNNGGIVCVGSHSNTSPPAGFGNVVGFGLKEQGMLKNQGLWIDLPIAVGEQFRDDTIRGLTLDHIYRSKESKYSGRFRAHGQPGQPILRVRYV